MLKCVNRFVVIIDSSHLRALKVLSNRHQSKRRGSGGFFGILGFLGLQPFVASCGPRGVRAICAGLMPSGSSRLVGVGVGRSWSDLVASRGP
eukprot:1177657-Prorocentrum_minimum.AAC.2